MKAVKFALPAVLTMALVAGAGSVFAEEQDSDAPEQGYYPCPGYGGPHGGWHGHHRGMMGPGYGPCAGPGYGMGYGMGYGARGALSDEGQARYDKIMDEYRGKIDKIRDELFVKQSELKALERASNPDVKAVTEKANEIVSLRGQLRTLRGEMDEALDKDVFGPERKAYEERAKAGDR